MDARKMQISRGISFTRFGYSKRSRVLSLLPLKVHRICVILFERCLQRFPAYTIVWALSYEKKSNKSKVLREGFFFFFYKRITQRRTGRRSAGSFYQYRKTSINPIGS